MFVPILLLVGGRGMRLSPLTDHTPKPLLPDGAGKPLLEKWLTRIEKLQPDLILLNPCWCGKAIIAQVSRWAVEHEAAVAFLPERFPCLETAGTLRRAFALLRTEMLLVINGDIDLGPNWRLASWAAAAYQTLQETPCALGYLLTTPAHKGGDFAFKLDTPAHAAAPLQPLTQAELSVTYAGVALLRAELVAHLPIGARASLGPILRNAAACGALWGEWTSEPWWDIGTPERLSAWQAATRKETSPPP